MSMRKYRSPREQVLDLAGVYLRHGGKQWRRKQIQELTGAVEMVCERFRINDVRQIGKKQVRWHFEQLRQSGYGDKTIQNYYRAWKLLWNEMGRIGDPPRPKLGIG